MKKIKYVVTMVVEVEVSEEEEKNFYPNGLNKDSLIENMQSDTFDELLHSNLTEYKAEGYLLENGKVVADMKRFLKSKRK
ncbi:hypothetical protein [Bacillus tequilensis]|uniref:Uncharacterized protein n=1 Tax=Bacillus tequilensis TaxID=227866 RepID=A0A6H0WMU0_9BACI|nr:hypothetical protein [Bacillus tequilensis]QIW80005.1 hypothetical protein G4P54_09390 [Bacillus tequilensis]